MERLKIYCEASFLNKFFNFFANSNGLVQNGEDGFLENLLKLKKLLESRTEIKIDCTFEEFKKAAISYPFKFLLKKYTENQVNITFASLIDVNNTTTSEEALFLLDCTNDRMSELSANFNTFICNIDSLKTKLNQLFLDRTISLKKNTSQKENFYNSFKNQLMPCYNLVFNDAHILDSPESREGIINWCLSLTDQSAELNISVIAEKADSKKLNEHIAKITKKLHLGKGIKSAIEIVKAKVHNRHLVTDFFWITCGHTLHFFENDKCKYDDEVSIRSIFLPKSDHKSESGYEQYMHVRKKIFNEYRRASRLESLEQLTAGNCNNRILNKA